MASVLFIGRFQPFHLGHLDAITQCFDGARHVIIAIGSAQYQGLPTNPFSAAIRKQMIEESLRDAGIPHKAFTIISVPDVHNDDEWVAHVERLCGTFGPVYTGTPHVEELFKKSARHEVITPRFRKKISGTMIRRKMRSGEAWKHLVPSAVASIIRACAQAQLT